ncbi:hypothetical protein [Maribacter sp. ACAM166]|uniref:hypothetical protein n=1 Tax=Maribacter sp. ACAM166 TaxID=2508996 RepID=UPI0010FCFCA6|nr:hypothetical protein [Maribacter sp. ACAM166]TLP75469.1 hypothetical protein ES765_15340 [Maribacter sp. ACAM166]
MKSILVVLFVTFTSFGSVYSQDVEKMDGTYVGYEDGVYVFTDNDGYKAEFTNITNDVSQEYNLTDTKYIGKQFIISFTVDTEMDEDDEDIQVSTIVGLVMPE